VVVSKLFTQPCLQVCLYRSQGLTIKLYVYFTVFGLRFFGACRDFKQGFASAPYAEGDENCTGSFEKLDVDCLMEVFKRLHYKEIIRNLRMISQKNPRLKLALSFWLTYGLILQ